jgi:ethanolamine utilization protein EutQ (cupin superfamily)
MHRFVTADDLSFRAGFTKLNKGEYVKGYFWYDELWLVMRGKGQVKTVERPSTKEQVNDLKSEDAFYIPKGTHVYVEGTSEDGPLIFMYVAIPASKKDGFWLAHMLPQDIQDVRDREEYHRDK